MCHPNKTELIKAFQISAQRSQVAQKAANTAFKTGLRDRDPIAYKALLTAFWAAQSAAFPFAHVDGRNYQDRIRQGDPNTIDLAIMFLQADPYFFRSGYLKQVMLRRLKQAKLTARQREELRKLVLCVIQNPHRFHLVDYARLAVAIATDRFIAEVAALDLDPDEDVRKRATLVLERLRQRHNPKVK